MVKLEEVLDEEFNKAQVGPEGEDDWDTDSGQRTAPLKTSTRKKEQEKNTKRIQQRRN